jgi:foldase protein PrsA
MTLTRLVPLTLLCALAVIAAGCGGGKDAKASVPDDAIAVVCDDNTPIPRSEFESLMAQVESSYKAQKQEFPKVGTAQYNDLKNRAVEYLVQRYRYAAEAKNLNVEVTDEQVQKRMDEIVKQSFKGKEALLLAELKKQGITLDQAKAQLHDRILQEELYKKVTSNIKISDADIEKYYNENKSQFTQPPNRVVRHILVKSKAKADEIHQMLDNGGNFVKLAKQYSTDPGTKKNGGYLTVSKGTTVPPFDKVAFELKTGEYSEPVKTQFGWHIIKAISDVKPESTTPLATLKDSIKQSVQQTKQNSAIESWTKGLAQKCPATYAVGFAPPKPAATTPTGTAPATTDTGSTDTGSSETTTTG